MGLQHDIQAGYSHRLNFLSTDMKIAPGFHLIPLPPTKEYTKNLYKGHLKQLDNFDHELMLVIEHQERMVLFSGCSHHGIIPVAKQALDKFPHKKINAIIGGFHLIGLPILNKLGKTKEEIISIGHQLNEMPIDSFYSCHCTGAKGYRILHSVLQEKLHPFPTGAELVLK